MAQQFGMTKLATMGLEEYIKKGIFIIIKSFTSLEGLMQRCHRNLFL